MAFLAFLFVFLNIILIVVLIFQYLTIYFMIEEEEEKLKIFVEILKFLALSFFWVAITYIYVTCSIN